MDEDSQASQSRSPSTAHRQPQRPPIEWPTRSGPNADNERAADLARHHVERVYEADGEPNEPVPAADMQPTDTMRAEPYDWQRYHSAWQQYYHQYFYRYYAGWWQQQRQLQEQTPTPQAPLAPVSDRQQVAQEIRQKVRSTVEHRAKKIKGSSHFKPIMAALTVGIVFLSVNYNQVMVGAIKQYIAPGNVITTPVIVTPNTQANIGPDPKIIIPKIGVEVPVVYDQPSVTEADYEKALERGVVRLGTTANPGTTGNVVIGGHSSNNLFNPGKYKYVFVNLRRLDVGDIFYLNYNSVRYTYKITVAKKIVSPTDTSALTQTSVPTVTLFTCDPPGTNINRLIVQATQIDPSPTTASANANKPTDVNSKNPLPSVAPSIWDRLFHSN